MIPILKKLFDRLSVTFRIQTGPKQVARDVGGDLTQIQAGRDVNVQRLVVVNVSSVNELNGVIQRELAQATSRGSLPLRPELPELPAGLVELSAAALGIVKAYDLAGSRIHVAFEALNVSGRDVAAVSAELVVNACTLRAKQFYSNDGQVRMPDPTRFPYMLRAGASVPMSIEFENIAAAVVYTNGVDAELRLELLGGQMATEHFTAQGPQPELDHALGQMQKWVEAKQSAAVLDVPIQKAARS